MTTPFTVLYIHPSAAFGGASKSLCEMLQAFPAGRVRAVVLCPPGSAAEQFRRAGAEVLLVPGVPKWDHTRYGFYRGLRWLLLLREIYYVLPVWRMIGRIRERVGHIDLVHANDITVGAVAAYTARRLHVPLVVHVRSLQNADSDLRRTRWQNRLLERNEAHVIAIDETVRRTVPELRNVTVIHNGLRIRDKVGAARPVSSASRPFRVAIIGVLLRLKGVFEFVEAARLCVERGLDMEFWIVGENVRTLNRLQNRVLGALGFAEDVRAKLEEQIAAYALGDRVKLLGFVEDVTSVYSQIDLLCFPSHLDAAGRPVFEAAWFGVPSIVAVRDPLPDTIADGISGLCIERPDARALADAIDKVYSDPALRERLGAGARQLAEKYFDQQQNSLQVLDVYRRASERFAFDGRRARAMLPSASKDDSNE
jgi:glycosyltransferase involved in cell wall biosynthesis